MATMIGEPELRQMIKDNVIIQNGDEKCAEGIKYDFRLGRVFLKAGFNSPKTYEELLAVDKAIIEPGEVVFVMTLERIKLPMDMYVTLYEKRKLSHDGINLLGGRCVDPGYEGVLIFGLHNVTGSKFFLEPGKKLVGASFERLSPEETVNTPSKLPESLDTFPEVLLRLIENYKPVNPNYINKKLEDLQTKLETDKSTLLTEMARLNCTLKDVDTRTQNIEKTVLKGQIWIKVLIWVLSIVAAIITGLLTGFFQKLFGIG